jgi:hypothetical protein
MQLAEARAVLDVRVGATRREITMAYRRAVQATHPDRGGDAQRFVRVVAAHRRLTEQGSVQFVRRSRWPFSIPRRRRFRQSPVPQATTRRPPRVY